LKRTVVVAGIHHDHEVERRHDVQPLAAKADAGRPGEFGAVAEAAAEPPLIAVEEQALAVDARLDRFDGPAGGQDLAAVPLAIGQQQAPELGGIARAKPQA